MDCKTNTLSNSTSTGLIFVATFLDPSKCLHGGLNIKVYNGARNWLESKSLIVSLCTPEITTPKLSVKSQLTTHQSNKAMATEWCQSPTIPITRPVISLTTQKNTFPKQGTIIRNLCTHTMIANRLMNNWCKFNMDSLKDHLKLLNLLIKLCVSTPCIVIMFIWLLN